MKSVFAVLMTITVAVMLSFVSRPLFAEYHDCEIWTAQDIHPCLVINQAFKARNGKGDSYDADYKMECTLQNILDETTSDSVDNYDYCDVEWDDNDGNMIVFQSKMGNDGEAVSIPTKIDRPISINLSDGQTVILAGGYPVSWGDGDWLTPFDVDCGNFWRGGATRFCPEARIDLDLAKNDNYSYRAQINIEGISSKSQTGADLNIEGNGKLVLRGLDIHVDCACPVGMNLNSGGMCESTVIDQVSGATASSCPVGWDSNSDGTCKSITVKPFDSCAPAVKLAGGAQLVLNNTTITTHNSDTSSIGFPSVMRVGNDESGMFSDYIEIASSSTITTTATVFSFKTAPIIVPEDFGNLKLGLFNKPDGSSGLGNYDTLLENDKENDNEDGITAFWEKYNSKYGKLIEVDGVSDVDCVLQSDLKSCKIDRLTPLNFATVKRVWNEFMNTYVEFPLDPPYWFYIDEDEHFNWKEVVTNDDGTISLTLDNGILHENYVAWTNMGQQIQIVKRKCPNGEDSEILKNSDEGDSLTCKEPLGGVFDKDNWQVTCNDSAKAHYDSASNSCVCNDDGLGMDPDGHCIAKFLTPPPVAISIGVVHYDTPVEPSGDGPTPSDDVVSDDIVDLSSDDGSELNNDPISSGWVTDDANIDDATVQDDEINNDSGGGGAFSCSLVTTSTAASSPLWIMFVAFPMVAIIWRRARH